MAIRRLGGAIAVLAVASVMLFAATEILPGDAAIVRLGRNATPANVAALRAEYGLDRPVAIRYLSWIGGIAHGDLGRSIVNGRDIATIIREPLVNSVVLAVVALAGIVVVATLLGLLAGSRQGTAVDRVISAISLAVFSVPDFVFATILVLAFAFFLHWLPPVSLIPSGQTPLDRPAILVLPVTTLVLVGAAFATRLVRAAVVDVSRLPHVESARLHGVSEWRVLTRYLLPSAIGPIAQVFAAFTGFVFGSTLVVERAFGFPGLGSVLVEGVTNRDAPIVQVVGMLIATAVVAAFLVADVIGIMTNPRLRPPARE